MIPKGCIQASCETKAYKSWSLFLICSPRWIIGNGDDGIARLFESYKAFGDAIGPHNLAVWFARSHGAKTIDNTDIERMGTYCEKFGLTPSSTPQVVTTHSYPDDAAIEDKVVANLNGNADESAKVLDDLTDQLLATGLNQALLNRSDWGHMIASAATKLMASTSCYLDKVSISVKTGVFNAEITHSANRAC